MKQFLYLASSLFFLVFHSFILSAQTDEGWKASKETVERLAKPGVEFNYYEEKVPAYTLPDIFTTTDGTKISSKREWDKIRRNEILELFRANVFGRVPATPYQTSFKVVSTDKRWCS